ncbi:hypothetical protein NEISICOT_03375 [Neisseria sicca ATCC 29256]|uniref:Uncharacterized protein n=1 Tax=Neisseria sicca ATCC 29256 TaxID=547045 RepID=C6M9Z4_NEISI|nr:hypothetical protein NEISICOT_03375 [Neisseria sicca ATCC 29256]
MSKIWGPVQTGIKVFRRPLDLVCLDSGAVTFDAANDLILMVSAWFNGVKGSFNSYNPIGR